MKKGMIFLLFILGCFTTHSQTFTSGTLNTPIPPGGTTATCYPITVSGLPGFGSIDGTYGLASVCFTIDHTWVGDLRIALVAPDGTSVLLVQDDAANSGLNYTGTCFNATATTPISGGTSPFNGDFIPAQNLGSVNNGQNGNGTWTLCILDTYEPSDYGTLIEWNLNFNNTPAPPPSPQANIDEPCNAYTLTASTTCTFETFDNTNSTASAGVPAPGCATYQGADVWLNVVVPAGGALIFDTQAGAMTDGGMAIYSGTCNNLTLISCDDNTGVGSMPQITANNLTPGTLVWIRVWSKGTNPKGTFDICVKIPPPPPPPGSNFDEPCGATPLTVGTACVYNTFDNSTATASQGPPAPGCANYLGNDIWITAVVPASGGLDINTQAGVITDAGIALYTGNCGNLTLIDCDDDSGPGLMPKLNLSGLTPGDTVWIRAWEYGNNNNGTFSMCVSSQQSTPCPISNLFTQDTIRACGTSYTLDASSAYTSYSWSTGAISQTINVTSSGWYKCTVTNGSCLGADSVFVSLVNANIVNSDTSICKGASLLLNLEVSHNLTAWRQISTQTDFYTRIVKTNAGYYLAAAQSSSRLYKSLDLNAFSPFSSILNTHNLSFGKDKYGALYYGTGHDGIYKSVDNGNTWVYNVASGFGCGNLDFDFDSQNNLYTGVGGYLRGLYVSRNNGVSWQNTLPGMDFTEIECVPQINKTYILTGNYIAVTSDYGVSWSQINGQAFSSNSIMVKHINSDVYIFTNTGKIYKSSDAGLSWNLYSTFPIINTPSVYLNDAVLDITGDWWVTIDQNGVFHSTDKGMNWVNENQGLVGSSNYLLKDGNDLIVTTSQGIFVRKINSINSVWSTGETTPSISVAPTQTTTYYCTVGNGITSCVDSVTVVVNNLNSNLFTQDTIRACGASYTLNAGSGYSSYSWSTGENSQSINVTSTGWYKCAITNGFCSGEDSVFVSLVNASILENDTSICFGQSLGLNINSLDFTSICSGTLNNNYPNWTKVFNGESVLNVIKNGGYYYLRTNSDVLQSANFGGPYTSLGFSTQVNQVPGAELMGFDNLGRLHLATGWQCLYYLSNGIWNQNGLCGFGTGGQCFNKLANGRIVISKGGFLRSIYYSDNNGSTWVNATNNDVDWNNITASANGNLFATTAIGGYGTKGVIRSLDNGSSWQYINSILQNISGSTGISKDCNGNLYIVGDRNLFKSTDNGINWNKIGVLPSFFDSNPQYGDLLAIGNNCLYYSGYISSTKFGLFKSENEGASWTQIFQPAANFGSLVEIDGLICYLSQEGIWALSNQNGFSFIWSTGETTPSISVAPTQTTTYYCTVGNGISSCVDSVTVTVNNLNPNLFTEDTIRACGAYYTLDVEAGYSSYSWNTGATTQSINVTNTGWYKCAITNGSCSGEDSVFVSLVNARILNNDTSICKGSGLILNAIGSGSSSSNTSLSSNLRNGLVANYSFNGNVNDESGNNNGTIYGVTFGMDANNQSNSSCSFNGINNYVEIPNAFLAGGQVNTFTMHARVKANTFSNSPNIWGKTFFWGEVNLLIGSDSSLLLFWANSITGNKYSEIYSPPGALHVGRWHDIVIVFTNSRSNIYVDGMLVPTSLRWSAQGGSLLSTSQIEATCNFAQDANSSRFGVRNTGGSWGNYLNGYIDEFNIWNRVLSITEIASIANGSSFLWSTGETTPSITVTPSQTTTYYNTFSNGISSCVDSVTVVVNPINPNLFEQDTIRACGASYSLDAGTGYSSYSWNTGATSQTIIVTNTGWYKCTITNGSCSGMDSVFVSLVNANILNNDTTICLGSNITLSLLNQLPNPVSQSTTFNLTNDLELWYSFDNNYSDRSNKANHGQNFGTVFTNDEEGNSNSAINIENSNYVNIPIPLFGGSTSVNNLSFEVSFKINSLPADAYTIFDKDSYWRRVCIGINSQGAIFFGGSMPYFYWGSGSLPNLIQPGKYYHLVITVENGVTIFYLNGVTVPLEYSSTPSLDFSSVADGNSDGRTLLGRAHPISGSWVNPFVGIIDDFKIYNRALTPLEVIQLQPNGNITYLWSTGETNPSISVTPNQTTTYYCTVSNGFSSCVDSVTVTTNELNPALFAPDTIRVCGTSYTLDAGAGYGSYSWNTGATTQTIDITNTGWYKCTITNGSCSGEDSVFVSLVNVSILNNDTSICSAKTLTLNASSSINSSANNLLPLNLRNGLVGYWPFNGNANDESGSGNNGTVYGAELTSDRFGNVNSAFKFNGVDNFITSSSPTISNNISVFFWAYDKGGYPNNYSINPRYISTEICNGNYALINNVINNPKGLLFAKNRGSSDAFSYSQPTYNTWQHIGVTSDGSQVKFYINGYLVSTVTNSDLIINGSNLYFGKSGCVFGSMIDAFNGTLDDVVIYNRVLSETDIQQLYTQGNSTYLWSTGETTPSISVSPTQTTTYYCTVSNGISSCIDSVTITVNNFNSNLFTQDTIRVCGNVYSLDAGAGYSSYSWNTGATTQSIDITNTGWYKCTITNGSCSGEDSVFVSLVNVNVLNNDTSICKGSSIVLTSLSNLSLSSYAINNSGTPNPWGYPSPSDGGYIPLGTFGAPNVFSISCFINPSDVQSGISIIFDCSHGGNLNWVIQNYPNISSGSNWSFGSLQFTLVPNSWQHLLITYNNGQKCVYVNGHLQSTLYEPINWSGNPTLNLGNWPEGARRFHGSIDELYITYDLQQTSDFTPISYISNESSNKFGLWHFDEGQGEITYKNSGQGYTLNNWTWLNRSGSSLNSLLWSTGETTPSISVTPTQTTTYYCTVSNGISSCVDSVKVVVNQLNPNLFVQDTIHACGASYTLDAGVGYSSYSWNTEATSQTIDVTSTGWYKCTVNNGSCSGEDSVFVSIVNARILNNDTSICLGSSLTLISTGSGFSSLNTSLRNGLVAYYPFDGNADDESGNMNNGTIYSAILTSDRFGNSQSSFEFLGNSSIRMHTLNSTMKDNFTYSVWVKPYDICQIPLPSQSANAASDFINNPCVIHPIHGQNFGLDYLNAGSGLYVGTNGLYLEEHSAGWEAVPLSFTGDLSGWHQLTIVYDNKIPKLFIDGQYKNSGIGSARNIYASLGPDNYPIYTLSGIGAGYYPPSGSSQFFNGKIDDIYYYNRALNFNEVNQLYNQSSYLWSTGDNTPSISVTPNQTTTYYCTVRNGISSCVDSVTIIVKQPTTSTTTISNCGSYSWNGNTYSSSGTYTKSGLSNAAGCDSTAYLVLTIKQPTTSTTTISNCGSYSWNGNTYSSSGTYTKSDLTNAAGCDSTAYLVLTIKQPSTSITTISNCVSYSWNGNTYSTSGTYTKSGLINATGCDSTAYLVLTIKQPTTSTTTILNCGYYSWNGNTYASSGTYTKPGLTNAAGCDSTAYLVLTIKQPTTSTTTISNCVSYSWNGNIYSSSGTYTKSGLTNAAGCDSTAYLVLTIKQPTTSTTTISNCVSYSWNANTYTTSGTYTKSGLTNTAGCDSIAILKLTINPAPVVSADAGVINCYGGNTSVFVSAVGGTTPYSGTGTFVNSAGTYQFVVSDNNGCLGSASVTIAQPLQIVVSTTTTNATANLATGSAAASATGGTPPYTYYWNNGATTATASNLVAGTYTVTVRDSKGCSATGMATVASVANTCNGFVTYTQDSWGAAKKTSAIASNYIKQKFTSYFRSPAYLTIGCATGNKLRITNYNALNDFLPSVGPIAVLPTGTSTNPGSNYGNALAGELVALTLNVISDYSDPSFSPSTVFLKDLIVVSGTFANFTVQQVLDEANRFIGNCPSSYNSTQIYNAVRAINLNYENGAIDRGYLRCPALIAKSNATEIRLTESKTVVIYPNPSQSKFNLKLIGFNNSEKILVRVYDLQGRLVKKFDSAIKNPISFGEDLMKGMYLVEVSQGDLRKTIKVVKE